MQAKHDSRNVVLVMTAAEARELENELRPDHSPVRARALDNVSFLTTDPDAKR